MTRYALTLPVGAGTITVHADTPDDLVRAALAVDLVDLATIAPAPALPARTGRPSSTPAASPTAAPAPCPHGPRTYREGTTNGRSWAAWMCAAPKGTAGQCAPVWVDDAPAAAPAAQHADAVPF